MAALTVTLPPALERWVEKRVAEGRFIDGEDYLRELVRRDEATGEFTARLRELIRDGLASGIVEAEPEDVVEEIIARYPADA